jgi:hypothetical protein
MNARFAKVSTDNCGPVAKPTAELLKVAEKKNIWHGQSRIHYDRDVVEK